jgi:hypothetical protein
MRRSANYGTESSARLVDTVQRLAACAGLKQVATSIIAYLMYCVPALLQAADYARATSMASRSMTSQAKIEASLRRGVTGIASASDGGVAVAVDNSGVAVAVGYGGVSAAAGCGGVAVAVGHGGVSAVVDGTRQNQ